MEQKYLSDDVFEQIKDFNDYYYLTEEQKLLIDKLIINEELKSRYKYYGLCNECKQPNIDFNWCQSSVEHYQQNFKNWTSENSKVDKFIQESQINAKNENEKLEWIKYDKFENIEYITKGGFGTIYKASWKDKFIWDDKFNKINKPVALKSLNNSKNITFEFLNEINLYLKMNGTAEVIKIHGITKDPKTSNFMMVMDYANKGNLRQRLNSDFNSLSWSDKLGILRDIAYGLNVIHEKGLTHRDFHSGNILGKDAYFGYTRITDLGLCKPANEKHDKVYGVLPYVAPEVLRGKKYTQESDVYSFGIIIYEVINGLPPYYDIPHEEFLALKICQGLRPSFNIKVPQLIMYNISWEEDSEIVEADEINKKQPSFTKSDNKLTYTTHHQAIYTSRLLNFNNLPDPKNADDEEKYSRPSQNNLAHQFKEFERSLNITKKDSPQPNIKINPNSWLLWASRISYIRAVDSDQAKISPRYS
ncbi:kinase-like domain-containing protein [Glomus cerebriforme]|uniref:Kinase-like domain-containing protein n=1 Tax=Glomus cerebriforme TaxID=658196 RepID=A0A397SHP7_9GLOM|nr:kinase-like domain-containing protein [Glomus cerebriforme]